METERVLSLDISSKTGWCLCTISNKELVLEEYGKIEKTSEPEGKYPDSYVLWAYQIFSEILQLIDKSYPDILVIEETSRGSKNAYSQKILEYVHFLIARLIKETGIESHYLLTEEWRRIVGCNKMSDTDKKRNKEVRTYKKKHKTNVSYDTNGKRIGLIGRKHLNVRKANEVFGKFLPRPLIMADEDLADALLLGKAYHIKKLEGRL